MSLVAKQCTLTNLCLSGCVTAGPNPRLPERVARGRDTGVAEHILPSAAQVLWGDLPPWEPAASIHGEKKVTVLLGTCPFVEELLEKTLSFLFEADALPMRAVFCIPATPGG